MADGTGKPVIFISYSHLDEPERTPEIDIHWLTDIQAYLAPAANGTFELWTDEDMTGGADWEKEIKDKLAVCDICILFVSRHSLASRYVIEVEIATILERQRNGHKVQIYPIVLSPFPRAAASASLLALNLRPRLDKPLSGFSRHQRGVEISKIADEIVGLLSKKITTGAATTPERPKPPSYVHITGLPETPYERLVGREDRLKRLDDAWADNKTNIISLVAEGGAGKSALVNEWLKRLQAESYRGAEAVLGWSFYSQGTKERATSADEFLNWALDKLEIKPETNSASAKGEAIAEMMTRRRVLLVLDGVEPLQHGLDTQFAQLKDQGLRALLRRFAATPPADGHGLIVLTSRLTVKDIARWQDRAAPIVDVDRLLDKAGVALLRENGVWGTDNELKAAAHDFGGHPLALGLLASFLKETQFGDVRRRDHVRAYFADPDNPRHDHAKRVMESYEKEWLAGQPVLLAIMYMIGLFDRPAIGDCLNALRAKPPIEGLTTQIVKLGDSEWQRAIARLREVRLISPPDPSEPESLDAHPLVREWFGERLKQVNETAWRAAHRRLYEHLRDTTKEGGTPTLEELMPLYQAIAHGCRAGRYHQALDKLLIERISQGNNNYANNKLGALGSNLAALSWFFDKPYVMPVATLSMPERAWVLNGAAYCLRAQGRFAEALPAMRVALQMAEDHQDWQNAAIYASNLSGAELLVGEIASAVSTAQQSVAHADRSGDEFEMITKRVRHAHTLLAAGVQREAECLFADAERRQRREDPQHPLLYSIQGYQYCELLLDKRNYKVALDRATETIIIARRQNWLLNIALDTLTIQRAHLGLALKDTASLSPVKISTVRTLSDRAVDNLYAAGSFDYIALGLLARAAFHCGTGDWEGAVRDLDEVEEITEPGPMRLFLCDMALERARLAFARIEAFAPLNGMLEGGNPPKPSVPSEQQIAGLTSDAGKQLKIAAGYIEKCGYHRRDEELAELQAVLRGEKKFADLPPRV
ncbi:MAG TPA: TIR domain-containing protein [Xanthobacteraceae bacterium]|nr:TIR domain-containing protein [Xanthobacteraceae bacterium]